MGYLQDRAGEYLAQFEKRTRDSGAEAERADWQRWEEREAQEEEFQPPPACSHAAVCARAPRYDLHQFCGCYGDWCMNVFHVGDGEYSEYSE